MSYRDVGIRSHGSSSEIKFIRESYLIVRFILLNFHHDMMDICKLCARVRRQNLMETMIVLHQLRHRALHQYTAEHETGK